MNTSPCAGHPGGCKSCVFAGTGTAKPIQSTVVVPRTTYGCVKGYGDVVHDGDVLGQMRGELFHPVSPEGARFLRESRNSLSQHL